MKNSVSGGRKFTPPPRPPPVLKYSFLKLKTKDVFTNESLTTPAPSSTQDQPSSSAEVKQRVELYLYSPSGLSWPVAGLTVPLPLP